MIVSMLAVLKAGAAYLPMDPSYPKERLSFMLTDSCASVLISTSSILDATETGAPLTISLDDSVLEVMLEQYPSHVIVAAERKTALTAQNLSYLIYTSGSTGTPKGAGNTHQGSCNLVQALIDQRKLSRDARALQFQSFSFDASFAEIMTALCCGAALVLVPNEAIRMDPIALGRFISEAQISHAHIPPALLPEIAVKDLEGLRVLVVAGEACPTSLVTGFAANRHMLNEYGPTEASVCVTITESLDPNMDPMDLVPIGRPILNTQIYILDASLSPLPVGVAGELYVAGSGLARGYLGRAGLTAERFVANPFTPGARMYRSGDLARWTEGGVLEYLGRADAQVKIRGFRIELGEIEAALVSIPGIAQCTVQARGEDGAKQLVAYLVAGASTGLDAVATIPEASALRALLSTTLPDYMVPAAFVVLESLPLTPNGKLDTRALPAPEITGESEYRTPVTEHEQLVASLFTKLTRATRVGLDDSFFALGGHSLLAMRLISQIRVRTGLELALRNLFEQPTVAGLAQAMENVKTEVQTLAASGAASVSRPPIIAGQGVADPEADGTQRVLSYGQIRLWTLAQIEGASGTYNMPSVLKLSGALRSEALERALLDVIERHEPLRTVIACEDDSPVGYVRALNPEAELLAHEDLSGLQELAREAALEQIIARDSVAPFDLSSDLMLRARLIKLTDSEHVLTLVMHHIAGDGVSMGVFCQELTQAYQARTSGQAPDWTPLSISYADHAAWQRAWLEDSGELARQSQSWQTQLADTPERLSLPTDYPREASRSRAAGYLPIEISAQTTAHLQSLANQHQTTLFTVLLALYGTFLARLANQSEVVIGSPIAGRTTHEVDGLIGFFVNTLALRVDASGHPDLNTLMERVKGSVNHALTHQDLPFERLVEDLGVARSLSHTPVFQSMLAWQTQETASLYLDDLSVEMLPVTLTQTKFDLTLSIAPEPDGSIRGAFEYDASLFTESRVAQWVTWLVRILGQAQALSLNDAPINNVVLVDQIERAHVLSLAKGKDVSNSPLAGTERSSTFTTYFEQQVLRTPEATALIYELGGSEHSISYLALNNKINQLARLLIAKGTTAGQTVAILMNRSPDMIISIMATLKAGASYLPLDLSYPLERLSYMLTDSQACAALCTTELATNILSAIPSFHGTVIAVNDSSTLTEINAYSEDDLSIDGLAPNISFNDLAYIMYTSGSTGRPKGVGFLHGSLLNLVHWQQTELPVGGQRVLQYSPIGFDVSAQEIAATITRGATLVLVSEEIRKDPSALLAFIAKYQIDDLHAPFVVLNNLALARSNVERSSWPKSIFTAGQQLQINPELRQAFIDHPDSRLYNSYGPTEAHVVSNYSLDSSTSNWELLPPIGWPIWNTQLYILDAALNMTPEGSVGELYIAGDNLARGYINRPGLTAERFIACPFIESKSSCRESRMYRTGDLARRRSDGSIEFMGRADEQVKIRGYRIELGEIEVSILKSFAQIAQVAVILREISNDKRLVAYLVANADTPIPEASVLRSALSTTLPDYMVPAAFVVLESLPLTTNGKLDTRALPSPMITGEGEYRAPVTEHEQLVAGLFAELTGATRVGLDDSFFALGGHSLLAMRLISQVRARTGLELALRTLFEQPTVSGIVQALEQAYAEVRAQITSGSVSVSRPPIVPGQGLANPEAGHTQRVLSYGQIRLWTLAQIEGDSGSYNMPAALRLLGNLREKALEHALRDVINRHEPLRTVIANVDDRPVGYVQTLENEHAPHHSILAREDLSTMQPPAREAALEQIIQRDSTAPFELSRDLMVRTRLIKLTDTEHVLTLVMHHIAGDGISLSVFFRELTQAYQARTCDQAPDWTPLSISYADHAAWQRAWLENSGELERQSESWKAQLADIPERLTLPTDYPRKINRTRAAAYIPIEISAQTTGYLQNLANQHQTTLFTLLVALYGALLARLANQNEVIIGSPVAGRNTAEVDGLVGFFINTLALRIDTSGHPDLNTLIERVKSRVNHALTHQELPFERLVDDLGMTRSLSHMPVFQAMLAWQTQDQITLSLGELSVQMLPAAMNQTKFDLTLSLAPTYDGAIRGTLEYDASLFEEHRIAQWVKWLVRMLNQAQALSLETTPVDALSLLDEREREQVIELFNNQNASGAELLAKELSAADTRTLVSLFAQQVDRTPDATAVVFGATHLSYVELDRRANQLARHLISLGIGPERIVGLALPRSIEMVVSLLAVLKTGAAYLPLDPDYPSARLSYMLGESGTHLLISQKGLIAEAIETLCLSGTVMTVLDLNVASLIAQLSTYEDTPIESDTLNGALVPDNLAYLIYTSGSTGMPKGAGNTHRGACNLVQAFVSQCNLTESTRTLQFSSYAFDASILEMMPTLCSGAALYLIDNTSIRHDPEALGNFIESYQITHAYIPPAMLPEISRDRLQSLQTLMVGGEVVSSALVQRHASDFKMFNCYGPTETSVCVTTAGPLDAQIDPTSIVPIGHPIAHTQIYILDAALNPLPVGVTGELYIAGESLGRGYLGRTGLTAERFLANPFCPGLRMYRSGDLARWNEDGRLEYLGRVDAQVKIRGFRIELGEIEAALEAIPGIAQCTVQARGEDGAKQLVAYLVAGTGAYAQATIPKASALRSLLATTLPDYMVPAAFVVLESLPLTPSGKLDVRTLPAPDITGEGEYRAPVTEHEQLVASLFAELTGAIRVGLDDSFFALGGNSLLAMRLVSQIRARTGLETTLRTLFEYPTVERFAAQFKDPPTMRKYQPLMPLNKMGSLPPLFCFPPAGGISTVYKHLSDELGKEHPLWGIQARGVDDDENQTDQTISEAVRTYVKAIKEVQPSGPYYLMGHSIGGTIAHEAAVQLEESGDTVAALFLLDTVVSYQQPESGSKSENEVISELMISMLKETTDQNLPPAFDDMLNLFQSKFEALGMIPVGTPKSYVLNVLKNSVQSISLIRNHALKKCHAHIIYFGATDPSGQDTPSEDLSDWQPYTDQAVRHYQIAVTHNQMLWQPVSYEFIARKVHELMVTGT
jgi:amino acid adenylation domain-containing protein